MQIYVLEASGLRTVEQKQVRHLSQLLSLLSKSHIECFNSHGLFLCMCALRQDPFVSIRRLPLSPLQALSKEAQVVVKTRTIQDVSDNAPHYYAAHYYFVPLFPPWMDAKWRSLTGWWFCI